MRRPSFHALPPILLIALAHAALAGSPAPDVAARHAALVAEGRTAADQFARLEARREAYDRAVDGGPAQQAALQRSVAALNADNAEYRAAAATLNADVAAHNATCGGRAAKAGEPRKVKDKAELEALKAAEATRVAECDAAAAALAARGTALDQRQAELAARSAALDAEVKAGNASIDEQEALGRALARELDAADAIASDWLERFNQLLASPAFLQRSAGIEGCKARREMVVSGRDLQTFVALHEACARNLAR